MGQAQVAKARVFRYAVTRRGSLWAVMGTACNGEPHSCEDVHMEQERSRVGTPATRAMGSAISGFMGEAGVSKPVLAEITGIPFGTLRRYVDGIRPPDTDQLVLIAAALNVRWPDIVLRADAILMKETGGVYPREELRARSRGSQIKAGDAPGITPDVAEKLRGIVNDEESGDD
jgi:transcriptional regulator with XRE-family HTH domain